MADHALLKNSLARELPQARTLPTEFRLFSAGINHTAHGTFVFDGESAKAVMSDFAKRGVPMVIDLQHDSLDADKRLLRNDAADAMGYFVPEVRPDGSLWATAVRWSTEGKRRLESGLQRYTSPAAHYDTKSRRIVALLNCALCSDPATRNAAPLMAASAEKIARRATQMISARLPAPMAKRVQALALERGTTVSGLITHALVRLASKQTVDDLLAQLLDALGLSIDADRKAITQALIDLIAGIDAKPARPSASSPPPAKPVDSLPDVQLSSETLAKIKAKGMTVPQFLAARKAAIKRPT